MRNPGSSCHSCPPRRAFHRTEVLRAFQYKWAPNGYGNPSSFQCGTPLAHLPQLCNWPTPWSEARCDNLGTLSCGME